MRRRSQVLRDHDVGRVALERLIDVVHPCEIRRLDAFVAAWQDSEAHARFVVKLSPPRFDRSGRRVTDVEHLCAMTPSRENRREKRRGWAEASTLETQELACA